MRGVEVTSADTPFRERLRSGFGYPLRETALPTLAGLALSHYVGLLPSYIGALASLFVWAATWRYAASCLLQTAHGFAEPPGIGVDGTDTSAWGLTAIHLLVVAFCAIAAVFHPLLLLPVLLFFALVLPAIDMSLAFDGDMATAINPLNWARVMDRFGAAYLIPVAINVLLGVTIIIASVTSALLPRLLALPVFAFAYSYLAVLAFHLMGVLIHQRHVQFGIEPEAPILARALGQNADDDLLAEVDALSPNDSAAAIDLLVGRLRTKLAPASIHVAYRRLLRQQDRRPELLAHGQIWIVALIAQGEAKRALSVLQECCGIDADFLPDDPRTCIDLADLSSRLGMRQIALHLCRGLLMRWPRDPQVPHIGLLAARLLAEQPDQIPQALRLLETMEADWAEHPQHADIRRQRQHLAGTP